MKGKPSRLARRRPTVDFPTPISPTRTTGRSRRFAKSVTIRGYTAPFALGKSAAMSRIVVLLFVLLAIAGALYFLSTVPEQQPTKVIEVDVPQGAPADGNAK